MGKTVKLSFLGVTTLLIITFNLCFPQEAISGVKSGLLLCGNIIIPSLFPFCALALFLFKSGVIQVFSKFFSPISEKIFHLSGEQFCVFFMSFLAGYPVGMRLIKELADNEKISICEAKRMSLYCINAGPAFILTAIGVGILNDKTAGIILLTGNFLATLILMLALESKSKKTVINKNYKNMNTADALVESTADAAASVFSICAWVILFSGLLSVFKNPFFPPFIHKVLSFVSEVTNASIAANKNIPLISAILSFSGLSVHCQVYSIAKQYAANYGKFLLFRVIHALISSSFSFIVLKIMRRSLYVLSTNTPISPKNISASYASSVSLFFMSIVFMISILNKKEKLCRKI